MTGAEVLRLDEVTKLYETPGGAVVAADRINLALEGGRTVVVIGPNGAGKSTLLRLIAGITEPTSGRIERVRRTTGLIELGAGFEPELSGRENLDVGLALHGFGARSRRRIGAEAIEFSGVGPSIDRPVKQYSAGMVARLGMAAALHSEPELLLIDEVLSVGDAAFQRRSIDRIRRMVDGGCALVLVTHQLPLARRIGERVVWIDSGRVVRDGPAAEIAAEYERRHVSTQRLLDQEHTRLTDLELVPPTIRPGGRLEIRAQLMTRRRDVPLDVQVEFRPPVGDEDWMLSGDDYEWNMDVTTIARSRALRIRPTPSGSSEVRFTLAQVPLTATVADVFVLVADEEGNLLDELGTPLTIREGETTVREIPRLLLRVEGPLQDGE